MTEAVSVAVPRPVWQTYSYSVPVKMRGGVMTGCRVVVPIGGSRTVGVVWEAPSDPPPGIKLKPLLERLDSGPLLPKNVMRLIRWAADYYMEPPGMTAAAAFPPGMQGNAVRMVTAGPGSALRHLSARWPLEYRLLSSIIEDGMDLDSILARETAEGKAESSWVPEKLPPPRKVSIIEPVPEETLLARTAQSLKGTAPRQADILAFLAVSGRTHKTELLRRTGAGRSSLDSLREKRLVREVIETVPRDSLQAAAGFAEDTVPELNPRQRDAVERVMKAGSGSFLLHGITGSGKTEVYLRLIGEVLESGKGAIVLVPEISLTPLAVSRFSGRFPGTVAVLHSGLSRGERLDTWNLVRKGERRIVIGPRSAVFAPLHDPGIIVVDEEHDGSYKQNTIPRYNGRDLAVVRAGMEGIPVVLGSASPSAESWRNAAEGRYTLLELPARATGSMLPDITLIDGSSNRHGLLSDRLLAGIGRRTAAGEQTILLVNRRGHSPVQMCLACGHVEKCPSCGISMTYHLRGGILRCHHCGSWRSAEMRCPQCSGEEFIRKGPGIQKVEQALRELLPGTRIIRMDADTTRGKAAHWRILNSFACGEGDVLLGTQMVAKGHDFPLVTLAAVIGAEMGLYMPDFRAAETTFDLLLQMAGRSGRSERPGEVIFQTLDPENRVIRLACSHDYRGFIEEELKRREALGFPPYTRMARLLWSGSDAARVRKAAEFSCGVVIQDGCRLLGPGEASLPMLKDNWRWNALITAADHMLLKEHLEKVRNRFQELERTGVRMETDIDPRNMM